jgi:hypothetical protein
MEVLRIMKLSDRIKKIKPGEKLVLCPSGVQALMTGIAAIELYPDKRIIRVYQNGAKSRGVMTEDQLGMSDDAFNIFRFCEE